MTKTKKEILKLLTSVYLSYYLSCDRDVPCTGRHSGYEQGNIQCHGEVQKLILL